MLRTVRILGIVHCHACYLQNDSIQLVKSLCCYITVNFYSTEISRIGGVYINVMHRHFAMQFDGDSLF